MLCTRQVLLLLENMNIHGTFLAKDIKISSMSYKGSVLILILPKDRTGQAS